MDSDLVELADVKGAGAAPGETPEAILLRSTLGADLQAALDGLPDAFREAVWLRDVDEFSYAEVAAMLDVPIGTMMSRILRGRHLLFGTVSAPVDAGPVAAEARRAGGER
jgi:DNA-directed RNA polymerase specialized sigma24 family protein